MQRKQNSPKTSITRRTFVAAAGATTAAQGFALAAAVVLLRARFAVRVPWGSLARVLVASVAIGVVAGVAVGRLSPVLAVATATMGAVIGYPVLLRILGGLSVDDGAVAAHMVAKLPLGVLRPAARRLVDFLAPTPHVPPVSVAK